MSNHAVFSKDLDRWLNFDVAQQLFAEWASSPSDSCPASTSPRTATSVLAPLILSLSGAEITPYYGAVLIRLS